MAAFYFFTDIDLLNVQPASGAFGPVAPTATHHRYRTCSLHSATGEPRAYAVCAGVVIVQQDSDPQLVNLILKPSERATTGIEAVSYYIYKGIKKSSLIDGDMVALNTNELTVNIKKNQDILNENLDKEAGNPPGTTTDRPSNKVLGYHLAAPGTPGTTLLDDLFLDNDPDFQWTTVKGGWSIGSFHAPSFGFQVLCDKSGPAVTMSTQVDHLVEVQMLPGSPTNADSFRHWNAKEQILNYLDPCAFYGSFYFEGLSVRKFADTAQVSGSELYHQVLSKFQNKNVVYLEIRNERNFSFNYFKNYGNSFRIAFDGASPTVLKNYYGEGWPCFRILNTDFPAGVTSKKHVIRLALPKGNNVGPRIHLSKGAFNPQNADADLKPPVGKEKFRELTVTEADSFTSEVSLAVPNETSYGGTQAVCSYIQLRYLEKFDYRSYPRSSSGVHVKGAHYMDNIFPPTRLLNPVKADKTYRKTYFEETYADDERNLDFDFMGAVTIVADADNIVFMFYPADTGFYYKDKDTKLSITGERVVASQIDSLARLAQQMSPKTVLEKSKISIDPELLTLEYKDTTDTSSTDPLHKPLEDISSVVISRTEYQTIIDTAKLPASFDQSLPVYIGLHESETGTDANGRQYKQYQITLVGYKEVSGNPAELEVVTVPTSINVHLNTSPPYSRHFTSAQGAANALAEAREKADARQRLRSWLFANNPKLTEILRGGFVLKVDVDAGNRYVITEDYVGKIQIALRVVIPYRDPSQFEAFRSFAIDRKYGPVTASHVASYQAMVGLDQTGIVDTETLMALDKDLYDIHFFNADPEKGEIKVLHDRSLSVSVGKYTVVSTPSGANLRTEPSTQSNVTIIKALPFNTRVKIISIAVTTRTGDPRDASWCYVEVEPELVVSEGKLVPKAGQENGLRGYIAYDLLWTQSEMPEPYAELHTITAGQTLFGLANVKYGATTDEQRRYYGNVLLYVNNPSGKNTKGIYRLNKFSGKFDALSPEVDAAVYINTSQHSWFKKFFPSSLVEFPTLFLPAPVMPVFSLATRNWAAWETEMNSGGFGWSADGHVVLRTNSNLWIPSKQFADSLRNVLETANIPDIATDPVEVIKQAALSLYDNVKSTIDEYFPVGTGFSVESGVGVTFGIPLGVHRDYVMYFWREDQNKFKLKVRGEIGGGLDTGIGAGFFFGIGKKYKSFASDDPRRFGIGGAIGARLEAGLRIAATQEYEFDISKDWALANMLVVVVQQFRATFGATTGLPSHPVFSSLGSHFLGLFKPFNIDPLDYLTKISLEGGLFGTANAGGEAGMTLADQDAKNFFSQTLPPGTTRDTYSKSEGFLIDRLLGLLTVSANVSSEAGGTIGIELEKGEKETDKETGQTMPKDGSVITIHLYVEASYATSVVLNLGILPVSIPPIGVDVGAGFKFTFEWPFNREEYRTATYNFSNGFHLTKITLYQKSGELDIYEGAGSQTLVEINTVSSTPTTIAELLNALSKISITRRISYESVIGRGYRRLSNLQKTLPVVIKPRNLDQKLYKGLTAEGYLTFTFTADNQNGQISTLVQMIFDDIVNNEGKAILEAFYYLFDYLVHNKHPDKMPALIRQLYDHFVIKLEEFEVHAEVGVGVAFDASLAAGAKARVGLNLASSLILFHGGIPLLTARSKNTIFDLTQLTASDTIYELLTKPDQ